MASGTIKFFNAGRGYGFVTPEDGGADVFIHVTSVKASRIVGPLNEGDKVSFEIKEGDKGKSAVNIARVK